MPIVYACIVPVSSPLEGDALATALERVSEELSLYETDLAVFIAPGASGRTKLGVTNAEGDLLDAILASTARDALPVERLMRWHDAEPVVGLGTRRLRIATCSVEPRVHFEFGRAVARTLAAAAERIAIVCAVEISKSGGRFDERYRRALAAWDVKSIVNTDAASRRAAGERAIAQTALLMGVLGGYRVQPRELAYNDGRIVAAIDILGRRKRV
jgi:hypothetical protein